MNEQEAVVKLHALSQLDDPEEAHKAADKLLCELLTQHGYTNVVAEFQSLKKWY